jgi:DNA-binding NarL/FixJ family response regulator
VTITVVVADDQALVRAGFRVLVNSASDLEVVGEASDGVEAVAVVESTRPDVVLMDVRMPKMDGLEATRQIVKSQAAGRSRILMVTTFDLDEYIFDALRFGASGFLLKDTPPDELLAAIRVIAQGDSLLAPSVTRRLIAEFASRPVDLAPVSGRLDSLTERERQVLMAIGKGKSNAEIGDELHMSVATAKTHVSRILAKLEARDRTQLVVIAFQTGIVTVEG